LLIRRSLKVALNRSIISKYIAESLDLPCLLFADEMKVYSMIGCQDDPTTLRLQDGIDNIVRWCADNNLFLNCIKCKVVSFTKKTEPLLFNYSINGQHFHAVIQFGILVLFLTPGCSSLTISSQSSTTLLSLSVLF
jgi:hypothetical protein